MYPPQRGEKESASNRAKKLHRKLGGRGPKEQRFSLSTVGCTAERTPRVAQTVTGHPLTRFGAIGDANETQLALDNAYPQLGLCLRTREVCISNLEFPRRGE